jgi:hypothetical protein
MNRAKGRDSIGSHGSSFGSHGSSFGSLSFGLGFRQKFCAFLRGSSFG